MLILPKQHVDEKEFLKSSLNKLVDEIIEQNQSRSGRYFIVAHIRYDRDGAFKLSGTVSRTLPRFIVNSIVFYVDNNKSFAEWLWTVASKNKVEFNQTGVAYLQAKGAMPNK